MADPQAEAQRRIDATLDPVRSALDRSLAPLLGTSPQAPLAEAAPDNPSGGDGTTLATIEVTVPFTGEVVRVPNITAFSYSSDVLQVGDAFSVTVPDPRGIYVSKLLRGARLVLSLSSPFIAGGSNAEMSMYWESSMTPGRALPAALGG